MKRVALQAHLTLDDNGNVTACRMGTAPGLAPMFSVEHEGLGAMDRCVTDVRHHFKMTAFRAEFDAKIAEVA